VFGPRGEYRCQFVANVSRRHVLEAGRVSSRQLELLLSTKIATMMRTDSPSFFTGKRRPKVASLEKSARGGSRSFNQGTMLTR